MVKHTKIHKSNENWQGQGIRGDWFKEGPRGTSMLSLVSFPFLFHAVRVGFGLRPKGPPSWKKHNFPEACGKWKTFEKNMEQKIFTTMEPNMGTNEMDPRGLWEKNGANSQMPTKPERH